MATISLSILLEILSSRKNLLVASSFGHLWLSLFVYIKRHDWGVSWVRDEGDRLNWTNLVVLDEGRRDGRGRTDLDVTVGKAVIG